MKMEEENQVKKDLTEFFNEKVERLINEIEYNKEIMNNQKASHIIFVNRKMQDLFKHIKSLLIGKHDEKIKKQEEYNKKFNTISSKLLVSKLKKDANNDIIKTILYNKPVRVKLSKIIDEREDHLNEILLLLGLSAGKQEKRRSVA